MNDFKVGNTIICIKPESNFYTKGKEYKVYKNTQGYKCIKGDDGLEDLLSLVISSFKKKDTK